MKRWLTMLAAIGISGASAIPVVACSTSEKTTVSNLSNDWTYTNDVQKLNSCKQRYQSKLNELDAQLKNKLDIQKQESDSLNSINDALLQAKKTDSLLSNELNRDYSPNLEKSLQQVQEAEANYQQSALSISSELNKTNQEIVSLKDQISDISNVLEKIVEKIASITGKSSDASLGIPRVFKDSKGISDYSKWIVPLSDIPAQQGNIKLIPNQLQLLNIDNSVNTIKVSSASIIIDNSQNIPFAYLEIQLDSTIPKPWDYENKDGNFYQFRLSQNTSTDPLVSGIIKGNSEIFNVSPNKSVAIQYLPPVFNKERTEFTLKTLGVNKLQGNVDNQMVPNPNYDPSKSDSLKSIPTYQISQVSLETSTDPKLPSIKSIEIIGSDVVFHLTSSFPVNTNNSFLWTLKINANENGIQQKALLSWNLPS